MTRPPDPAIVLDALPPEARALLEHLGDLAGPGARVALVGGAVRDPLLGVPAGATPDLDIVVSGAEVRALSEKTRLPYVFHPAYGNATLRLPDGLSADLVRARREDYPVPGGPPRVTQAGLEQDLARRDFTLNALALELTPGGARLTLPAGLPQEVVWADFSARRLRPLGGHSFHDDPSRLVRGARLAARLGLEAHPELLGQVPAALEVAPATPRLDAELRLLLNEPRPGRAARLLEEWGAGSLLPPGSAGLLERLDRQGAEGAGGSLSPAALLSLPGNPTGLAAKLGLGGRPLELLARARSGRPYPPGSPEARLRELLDLGPGYSPLQGRDLLELGLPASPEIGRTLAWLAAQRQAGLLRSRDDERRAVLERLESGG